MKAFDERFARRFYARAECAQEANVERAVAFCCEQLAAFFGVARDCDVRRMVMIDELAIRAILENILSALTCL